MKTLLKLAFGLLAAAVVLAVGVVVFVLLFVDPNDYRDEIAAFVKSQTGRDLVIEGQLGLALLPCCGIELGETALSNPPGFPAREFARVERVRLGLRLWPLLTARELIVGEVDLRGLDVALERRADGTDNWSFAAGDGASAADQQADDTGLALSVAGINLADATLAYRDAVAQTDYRLEGLNLRTGAIEPGEPFDLEVASRLIDAGTGLRADAALQTVAALDLSAQRLRLDGIELTLALAGEELPAQEVQVALQAASLDYDLDRATVELGGTDGTVTLRGKPLAADSAVLQVAVENVDFAVETGVTQLRRVRAELAARGGSLPGTGLDATVSLDGIDYDLDDGSGRVDGLKAVAAAAGAQLQLEGAGVLRQNSPQLRGQFRLPPGSPREWLAALGEPAPQTADPGVLGRLEASGRYELRGDALAVSDLAARLDDTQLTGEFAVSNPDAPRARVALAIDAIDADRYLAPASEAEKKRDKRAVTELPREELRDLTLDGTLRVGELGIAGTRLQDLQATASLRDGVLTLEPLSARLYDGRYEGRIRLDGSGDEAQVQLRQSLDAVQAGRLLSDLADIEQLEGLVVARLDLSGSGRTDADLRRTLAGTVSFELADGVYKGLDIWHEIRTVRARLRGEPPPARTGPAQTRITALDFGGRVADGRLRSERLVVQIPFLRITGDGVLDLASEDLDYRFQARVLQAPEFPDGERLKDLEGWTIPLRLGGTLEQPKLGVDLAEFAKTRAAEEIRNKLFEKLGLEEKRAPDGAKDPADQREGAPAETAPPEQDDETATEPQSPEDLFRQGLKDLLGR